MQNRYTGDIGDFVRYALLRVLSEGQQLGVAWYLYPDETHNNDGMHIKYLCRPEVWRPLDPELFDALADVINRWQTGVGQRTIAEALNRNLLPGAVFADELLDVDVRSPDWCQPGVWETNWLAQFKRDWRARWFERVMAKMDGRDIVYVDPDNSLCRDEDFTQSRQLDWKRLPLREALALSNGRAAILYHHNSHFPGGHRAEIRHWMAQLPGCTHAFYCRRYVNRTYFVVNPDTQMVARLAEFAEAWRQAELRLRIDPQRLSYLIVA